MSYFFILFIYIKWIECSFAASPIRVLVQENRLEDAEELCHRYETTKTLDNEAWIACTWVYFRLDKFEIAAKFLRKIKRDNPQFQLLEAYALMKRKKYEEAKKTLSQMEKEHKGTSLGIQAQELYGETFELIGQLETAAFIYKQVVTIDPKRARAHWGLGRHYLSRGDNARAVHHFEQTAKLWPKHLGSRFNLGVISYLQDDTKESAKWLSECYKLNRADPDVLEYLGLLFEKKGLWDDAIKYWQKALEIKKDSSIAKEKLGIYYAKLVDRSIERKRWNEGLIYIEGAIDILGGEKLSLQRGIIYRNLGQYEKATSDLLIYLKANPSDPTALREIGIAYLNLKLLEQASSYFARALSAEPQSGYNHAWMAFVLEGKGELQRAKEEWKQAIEYFKEPKELERATRRLAQIEKKLKKQNGNSRKTNSSDSDWER